MSRYSYVSQAPRSTIWDYNFSNSKVAGVDCQPQPEKKETNFSFVPRTENKPEPSTAEKVRLGYGESRQSRARTRNTTLPNITGEEKKPRNPVRLPSWQLSRRPASASSAPPKASPEILSPLSSPPPLKSCLKVDSRSNSLGRNVKISSYSPATPTKYNVNFSQLQDTGGSGGSTGGNQIIPHLGYTKLY